MPPPVQTPLLDSALAVSQQGHNAAVASFFANEDKISDQLGDDVSSETAQTWDAARRVREPIAWALLAFTAIYVLVGACQLFNLAGAGDSVPAVLFLGRVNLFALRAAATAPVFVAAIVIAPPVLSVVLVAFCGGLTDHARQVVQTTAAVQAVAFVLGVISVAGAAGISRPGSWFILQAAALAIGATALIFTGAVLRSQALRPQWESFGEDDQDIGDQDENDDRGTK
jgi:hypothetical protein